MSSLDIFCMRHCPTITLWWQNQARTVLPLSDKLVIVVCKLYSLGSKLCQDWTVWENWAESQILHWPLVAPGYFEIKLDLEGRYIFVRHQITIDKSSARAWLKIYKIGFKEDPVTIVF